MEPIKSGNISGARYAVKLRQISHLCSALAYEIEQCPEDVRAAREAFRRVRTHTSARVEAHICRPFSVEDTAEFVRRWNALAEIVNKTDQTNQPNKNKHQ